MLHFGKIIRTATGKVMPFLLDFPCPLCRKRIAAPGSINGFCSECLASLPLISGPRCRSCGGPLDTVTELCSRCLAMPVHPWERAVALFQFRDAAAEAVLRFKFSGEVAMARAFAAIAAPVFAIPEYRTDCIVPVPLFWFREWVRGYNQAELFAGEVARLTGIPMRRALKRTRSTGHQARLSREERMKNLRNAFAVKAPETVKGKSVLLVDDVLTTGATLHTAAKALLTAGAARIVVLVIARR